MLDTRSVSLLVILHQYSNFNIFFLLGCWIICQLEVPSNTTIRKFKIYTQAFSVAVFHLFYVTLRFWFSETRRNWASNPVNIPLPVHVSSKHKWAVCFVTVCTVVRDVVSCVMLQCYTETVAEEVNLLWEVRVDQWCRRRIPVTRQPSCKEILKEEK